MRRKSAVFAKGGGWIWDRVKVPGFLTAFFATLATGFFNARDAATWGLPWGVWLFVAAFTAFVIGIGLWWELRTQHDRLSDDYSDFKAEMRERFRPKLKIELGDTQTIEGTDEHGQPVKEHRYRISVLNKSDSTIDNVRVEIYLHDFTPAPLWATHESEQDTTFSINPGPPKQFDVCAFYQGTTDSDIHWLLAVPGINPVSPRQDWQFKIVAQGRDTTPDEATFDLKFSGSKKTRSRLTLVSTLDREGSPPE